MPPVAVIETIRAPIERVFDFIAHVETHVEDFEEPTVAPAPRVTLDDLVDLEDEGEHG